MRPVTRFEPLIPIAMAASLLLPMTGAALGFVALGLLWIRYVRGQLRRPWLLFWVPAVVIILIVEAWTSIGSTNSSGFGGRVEQRYEEIWQQLDRTAATTIELLGSGSLPQRDPLAVFEILNAEATVDLPSKPTLLLLDDRDEVYAWGGQGLLHEIEALPSLSPGRHHQSSFSAVTLVAIQRFEAAGREWRVAAGLSLRTETFPFADLAGPSPSWTVVAPGSETGAGVLRVRARSGPDLVFEEPRLERNPSRILRVAGWRRVAILVWGLALLTLSWVWTPRDRRWAVTATVASGLFLMGIAAQAPSWASLLLAGAGGLGVWSGFPDRMGHSRWLALLLGGAAVLSSPVLAFVIQQTGEVPDLGSEIWTDPGDLVTSVALALLVWVLLAAVPRSRDRVGDRSSLFLWVSLLVLLASAAALEHAALAMVLLAISGVAIALWKWQWRTGNPTLILPVLGIVAAMLSATGWELALRLQQKERIREEILPAMAPPLATEIESLADEMETFLRLWDVADLAPAQIGDLSPQDLAFEIWRQSPLARYRGLSALRVLRHEGGLSSFSFGLPLNEESWVDWSSPLLGSVPVPIWQDAVLVGDGELRLAGDSWAYAEYALALQPGFRLPRGQEGDLAEVLLKAGPTVGRSTSMDLGGAVYGLFTPGGQPIVFPWPRPPKLSSELLAGGEAVLETPDGPAYAFSAVGDDGVRVLFLAELTLIGALERVGSHAFPSLLVLAALILLYRLPRWTREGIRSSWYHIWHSYSRRLVLMYSVLLLVPLGVTNLLVVRAFEDRLVRELEATGLLAVQSAQGVLGEHVLALKPGFGIDAALDDELLHWLSGVVHHDVNLYWRGSVYASSKTEVFTAGFLPRRIPGEIYSGLTLLGHAVSMRTNQAGRSEYLELYAPLTVPGISFGETRVIVSLPMLAQQEQTAQQIASLRRRFLLGTAAVVLLIMVLGARLARKFTTPLTDIVEGTQRIAAGEASLNLQPVELELATLVDAIDDMAARIHAAREDLLREKSVVDRMVENITAGIVSLDQDRRVVMANRVAWQMLGLQVGEDLEAVIGQSERLAPLAQFVSSAPVDDLTQSTVILEDANGDPQEWTLVWVPLPGAGEPSALLVVEDVTEVLRGQRLQAWAEMARMIAHEIKNPLTPIRLSAEHMQEVFESDPASFEQVFESCTSNILVQVGELQEIASEFSTYSRIPKIEPRDGNLVEVVERIVAAYGPAAANDVRVELKVQCPEVRATFDAKLVGRAVRNLLENALRAAPKGSTVEVSVGGSDSVARVLVADRGPGVKEAWLAKIFDPYFSTHDAGTGLGLPIAKRIAEEHGGQITARNRDSGGLEVSITLPAR